MQLVKLNVSHPFYREACQMMESSFPACERRSDEHQLLAMRHPNYFFWGIVEQNQLVGVAGCWQTEDFVYLENFCIKDVLRNKGYGSKALQLLSDTQKSLILEAELPTSDLTRRRIAFYKRNKMVQNAFAHIMPHYHVGDEDLPLVVLSYGKELTQGQYDNFKQFLDANVEIDKMLAVVAKLDN